MRKVLVFILIAALLELSCTQVSHKPEQNISGVSAEQLSHTMKYLTSAELGGRETGTPYGRKAAEYIAKVFKKAGLKSFDKESTYLQSFKIQNESMQNIVAYLEGSDPDLKDEALIIGAHYDHLGIDETTGEIYRGANDNASGVTALLGIAKVFGSLKEAPKRTVIFIAFDAEEIGLYGSGYYTKNPLWKLDKIVFMINLDVIGQVSNNTFYVMCSETSPSLKEKLDNLIKQEKGGIEVKYGGFMGSSDHVSFYPHKIPAYFFMTDGLEQTLHNPVDKIDKINLTGLKQVSDLAFRFAVEVANLSKRPEFVVPVQQKRPILGIYPDAGGNKEGVLIAGCIPNLPAEKAGILKGDIIIKVDDQKINKLKELYKFLLSKKAGDKVKTIILRDNNEINLEITLIER
jgi:hypothetical protein